jgi:hypothetical protein
MHYFSNLASEKVNYCQFTVKNINSVTMSEVMPDSSCFSALMISLSLCLLVLISTSSYRKGSFLCLLLNSPTNRDGYILYEIPFFWQQVIIYATSSLVISICRFDTKGTGIRSGLNDALLRRLTLELQYQLELLFHQRCPAPVFPTKQQVNISLGCFLCQSSY